MVIKTSAWEENMDFRSLALGRITFSILIPYKSRIFLLLPALKDPPLANQDEVILP